MICGARHSSCAAWSPDGHLPLPRWPADSIPSGPASQREPWQTVLGVQTAGPTTAPTSKTDWQPPGRKLQYGEVGQPLYGTPSGLCRFYVKTHNALNKHGLKPSSTDPYLCTRSCCTDHLNCCMYVDDCVLTYTNSVGERKFPFSTHSHAASSVRAPGR